MCKLCVSATEKGISIVKLLEKLSIIGFELSCAGGLDKIMLLFFISIVQYKYLDTPMGFSA